MGYTRTKSTPSLVAGLGLGASYAVAGKSPSAFYLAEQSRVLTAMCRLLDQGEQGLRYRVGSG